MTTRIGGRLSEGQKQNVKRPGPEQRRSEGSAQGIVSSWAEARGPGKKATQPQTLQGSGFWWFAWSSQDSNRVNR